MSDLPSARLLHNEVVRLGEVWARNLILVREHQAEQDRMIIALSERLLKVELQLSLLTESK